ncbi:transcriptional regulator [Erysipelothrix sp. HDW6C]|nr:transcriptional regulator [Erysipelothrix sp. HDW6C]
MSSKTKLSTIQLNAIEEGNIQFFKDDLSYLSYFVRYYANALNINYDELRLELDNTINAYTDSVSLSQIQKQDEITSNVKKKANSSNRGPSTTMKRAKRPLKMDVPTIGLLVLAIAILVSMVYVGIKYVGPMLANRDDDPIQKPEISIPGTEKPGEGEAEKPEEKPTEPEKPTSELVVKKIDETNYEISGWKEGADTTFEFQFVNASWMSFMEDGNLMPTPNQAVYEAGSNAKAIVKASKGKVFDANFGNINGNTINLNGVKVEIDPAIATTDVATLTFKFVEGATN